MTTNSRPPHDLKADLLAGMVVFLVALPLCLGIALASGAPLFAGIIAGVVGGIVVGALSGSAVSVAGPAAGLTAIVLGAITSLGSYEAFALAVFLSGLMQLGLGFARAGAFSSYLPSNVIEGMLAAIGVIIIMKQLPHAAGSAGGGGPHGGALLITAVSLGILVAWNQVPFLKKAKAVPGALVAVLAGIVLKEALAATGSALALRPDQLVTLPVPETLAHYAAHFTHPDFSLLRDSRVWVVAATLAAVASIETLLCIEAADKMDPYKRYTDTDRELKAQGVGNAVSGLLGGIPMTSVIVRTTANVSAGGRTKAATISHGVMLLVAVALAPGLLNHIPLATLAAVLLMTGYRLASPAVFSHMWRAGKYQFVPFAVTVVAVVTTDLLKGVAIGLLVSVLSILYGNMRFAYRFKKEEHHEGETIHLELAQEVSFLNKAAIKRVLRDVPQGSTLVIDASQTVYVDHDVLELIRDFLASGSKERGVKVKLIGFKRSYKVEDAVAVH
ncbi:MAG: SulP family inorganic anion transporter [Elusimicrobiota bacterium]|nr:SulP family inorganic anion transporter [Elusimicrobiota bacterium]